MDRKLTILLVEDELNECKAITEYVDNLDDTMLIGVTNNEDKALEFIKDLMPDAVILDLELHKGCGNGLSLLKKLDQLNLSFHPYILITTNNTSPVTYGQARSLKADFIFCKAQDDYCAQNIIEFLRSLKSFLHSSNRINNLSIQDMTTETPTEKNNRILKKISREIEIIGISPKAIGRQYIVDGIYYINQKPRESVCSVIAQKYGKSDASVERAMQNAINRAWRTSDIDVLYKNYTAQIKSSKGVPTVLEFLYYYADKIKNQ